MKWWMWLAALVVAPAMLAFALAWTWLDPREVTESAVLRPLQAAGFDVQLGELELSLLPSPTLHVRSLSVRPASAASRSTAARAPGDAAAPAARSDSPQIEDFASDGLHATLEHARLGISLPALLIGKIAIRSIELHRLRFEGAQPPSTAALFDAWAAIARAYARDASAPRLWVSDLRVHDGEARLGAWQLAQLELRVSTSLDGSAEISFDANAAGIGRVEQGRVEIDDVRADEISWRAEIALVGGDVAGLRERLAPGSAVWGNVDATLRAEGRGARLTTAALQAELRPLDARTGVLSIQGDASLKAQLGRGWSLDLTQAEVALLELRKPIGAFMQASAALPEGPAAILTPERVRIELGGDGELWAELGGLDDPELRLQGEVDFAQLRGWSGVASLPVSGRLHIDQLIHTPQRGLAGTGRAESVALSVVGDQRIRISGPLFARGGMIGGNPLELELAGQVLRAGMSFDLAAQALEIDVESNGVELASLTRALAGQPLVSGRLFGRMQLRGAPRLTDMRGSGSFEVPGGELARTSLDEMLGGAAAEQARDADAFERLAGSFTIEAGEVEIRELELTQGGAVASASGSVSLSDGGAELYGRVRATTGGAQLERALELRGPITQLTASLVDSGAGDASARAMERRLLRSLERASQTSSDAESRAIRRLREQRLQRQLREIEAARSPLDPASSTVD